MGQQQTRGGEGKGARNLPEPETIKICIGYVTGRTIKDFNSTVTVVDGPVTVWKNFYSFGLWSRTERN